MCSRVETNLLSQSQPSSLPSVPPSSLFHSTPPPYAAVTPSLYRLSSLRLAIVLLPLVVFYEFSLSLSHSIPLSFSRMIPQMRHPYNGSRFLALLRCFPLSLVLLLLSICLRALHSFLELRLFVLEIRTELANPPSLCINY